MLPQPKAAGSLTEAGDGSTQSPWRRLAAAIGCLGIGYDVEFGFASAGQEPVDAEEGVEPFHLV
jgi:hypothetical protein